MTRSGSDPDSNDKDRDPLVTRWVGAVFGGDPKDPNYDEVERRTLRRWTFASSGVLAAGCIILAGLEYGAPVVVLLFTACALLIVIATLWGSVRALLGEARLTGADAFAIGAPRVEEEQKRAVLRALKDLEFERSVGKISEEDYSVLVQQYREEAKRLLRLIDRASADQRKRASDEVDKRLRSLGLALEEPGSAAAPNSPPPAPPAADEPPMAFEPIAPHVQEPPIAAAPKKKKKKNRSQSTEAPAKAAFETNAESAETLDASTTSSAEGGGDPTQEPSKADA